MIKDEALKMAIEALAKCKEAYLAGPNWQKVGYDILDKSQQACKDALETPECNTHPKAPHGFNRNASHSAGRYVCDCEGWQLEWQGLSEDEVQKCYEKNTGAWVGFYDQIEQALKDKNT